MAPHALPLPKSESKKNFLSRIGLDEQKMRDRRLYDLMKREASEGRTRIIAQLKAEDDPYGQLRNTVTGPDGEEFYPSSYIGDQALSEESLRVYANASPETRAIYDLAYDPDRPNDPNWIIRWFLWHVFRYRDGRQARQKMSHVMMATQTPPVRPPTVNLNTAALSSLGPMAHISTPEYPWACGWRPFGLQPEYAQTSHIVHKHRGPENPRVRYDPVRDCWDA